MKIFEISPAVKTTSRRGLERRYGTTKSLSLDSKEQFDDYIQKNCSEFIQQVPSIKSYILYRGISTKYGPYFNFSVSNTPVGRIPKAVPITEQELIDNGLENAGFTALRRNSIFCTGSLTRADGYGDPHVVFPLNGFTFTWSERYGDMVEDFKENKSILQKSDFIEYAGFRKENLARAIATGHEIYIHGRYLMVNFNKWLDFSNLKFDLVI